MTNAKILGRGNGDSRQRISRRPARLRIILALATAAAAVAVLAACPGSSGGSSGSSSPVAASSSTLKTASIGGATVLTNGKGFTLYSFAPDTSTKSNCNGACARVLATGQGPATASGVTGTFATIKRSNGSTQTTFDGHPLYTYVGDTAPGQAKGNGLNLSGGAVARGHHVREHTGRRFLIGLRRRRRLLTRTPPKRHGGLTDDRTGTHDQAGNDTGGGASGARGTLNRRRQAGPESSCGWQSSGLLIATAAIHLDLYLTGYQTIPVIGWLFLLQVIAAFALGLAVLAIPGRYVLSGPAGRRRGSRLRPRHPRRVPPVGLDRAVRVHRGPHDRRHRRRTSWESPPSQSWPRSRSPPAHRATTRRAAQRRGRFPARIPPGGHPGRPPYSPPPWRSRRWCCSASPEAGAQPRRRPAATTGRP